MSKSLFLQLLISSGITVLPAAAGLPVIDHPTVHVIRTPSGGIQPQAAVDAGGTVHLVFYRGEPSHGDIYYTRRAPKSESFSSPVRVNSQEGSAMAMGSIRGAQMTLGKAGRVHIVWNGAGQGAKKVTIANKETAPLLYTRLSDSGQGFEPERNLLTCSAGLDGGSSVAADAHGNVYVFWQAGSPGGTEDESGRTLFVARSQDEGKTFATERPAIPNLMGACPCCGMHAFADPSGAMYVLFRGAKDLTNRDELLLFSPKPGSPFAILQSYPWRTGSCPMTSASLNVAPGGVVAAWEKAGQVYFTTINGKSGRVSEPASPGNGTGRKHPAIVTNSRDDVLLVWTEGTGWAKGGAVAWEVYDHARHPLDSGRADGLPVWSLPTAIAEPDGSFTIIY